MKTISRLLCAIVISFLSTPAYSQVSGISSSNLPLIVINTKGNTIIDASKIPATMKIIYNGVGQANRPTDVGNIYSGDIGIEIRGTYSATLPQKPYGFETRGLNGANLNVSLLGMPAENDWILLANYNDKTFMRNSLAYELSRKMGHYAARTRLVEVIIENYYKNYEGVYLLIEKIKQDKGRVNIAKLTNLDISGDDVTGGYIFKIDYFNQSNSWQSNYRPIDHPEKAVYYVFHDPDVNELFWLQEEYLKTAVNSFESVLYGSNFKDSEKGYPAWIDVNSFIDYFIINEVARNVDGFKKSVYFFKDKDSKGGKINAGPVWDFDWAWKNIWDCSTFQATDGSGWSHRINDCLSTPPYSNGWIIRLLQDENFANALNKRYFELRKSYLSFEYLNSYIDSVQNLVNEAQVRHYTKWPILSSNVGAPEVDFRPTTYAGEVNKFKNWIKTRLTWLDGHMLGQSITGVDKFETAFSYRIFPNPDKDVVYLESSSEIISLDIFNSNGECILTKTGISAFSTKLDVSGFSPGIYVVHLKTNGNQIINSKLVIR